MTIWLLTYLLRPVVITLSAIFHVVLSAAILGVGVLTLIGGIMGLVSGVAWIIVWLGGVSEPDTTNAFLLSPIPTLLAMCWPLGLFAGATYEFYKEIDKDTPKREKKQ